MTLLFAGLLAAVLARSLARPLRELDVMARRMYGGDFDARTAETGPSETRQLARTLNEGARRLGHLIDSQTRFVSDAAHQLRTPLTALRLNLDNVVDTLHQPAEATKAVDRLTAEVVRMTRLVNDLLTLAALHARTTQPEPINLADVVNDRINAWTVAATERGIGLNGAIPAELHIWAPPGHTEQILDNLLSNALAASATGGAITIAATPIDHSISLTVTDQGQGMTPEQISHAFDRFYRARPGGTGLGLAIVKELVDNSEGTVSLRPVTPHGLVVDVRLRNAIGAVPHG